MRRTLGAVCLSLLIITCHSLLVSSYRAKNSVQFSERNHGKRIGSFALKESVADITASSPAKKRINSIPCGDDLDQKIMKLALPAILNFAIIPVCVVLPQCCVE